VNGTPSVVSDFETRVMSWNAHWVANAVIAHTNAIDVKASTRTLLGLNIAWPCCLQP
jgi:hypothetical protein